MSSPDPLYVELRHFSDGDATAYLLGIVAAQESGNITEYVGRSEQFRTVFREVSLASTAQIQIFADAFDRALGILAVTNRDTWVTRYGAYAEVLGRVLQGMINDSPRLGATDRERLQALAPLSGVVTYEGVEYRIFDVDNPRSDAELSLAMHGGANPEQRSDERVRAMSEALKPTDPVRLMLESTGAVAANDRWIAPYLYLLNGQTEEAEAAFASAAKDLGQRVITVISPGFDGDHQTRVDFMATLISVEEVAESLLAVRNEGTRRERACAEVVLNRIGTAVGATTRLFPPFFEETITSIWNDGSATYRGVRQRLPSADLTQSDLREMGLWLNNRSDNPPAIIHLGDTSGGLRGD